MPLRFAQGLVRLSRSNKKTADRGGVSMRCGGVRRAFRAPMCLSHLSGVVAAALLAALAAGCSSQQTTRLAPMNVATSPNPTVTFESIDGPPPEVFRKLVASLNDAASAPHAPPV